MSLCVPMLVGCTDDTTPPSVETPDGPDEPDGPDDPDGPDEPEVTYEAASDPYLFDDSNTLGLKTFYTDTIEAAKKNYVADFSDYGVVSDESANQSKKMQAAIDDVTKRGGGVLYLSRGTYCFKEVFIKSNVHIVIQAGTVLRPVVNAAKVSMFSMGRQEKVTENCSIRCLNPNDYYIVKYDDFKPADHIGFINVSTVKNFKISDFKIYDCYTKGCGVATSGITEEKEGFPLRPCDAELTHCIHYDAHPGYGLVQTGAAERMYFEDLYCTKGVTLRLETGSESVGSGVYDLHARNIRNEDGLCALLMGPHATANGIFLGDGFWAKGSASTICWGKGGSRTGSDIIGSFAEGCKVINVEGIFGIGNAFTKLQEVPYYNPKYYDELKWFTPQIINGSKWLVGASTAVVTDGSYDSWQLEVEGIRSTGFDPEWVFVRDKDFGYPDNYNEFGMASEMGFSKDRYFETFTDDFTNTIGQPSTSI